MKLLAKPLLDQTHVYDACVRGVGNPELTARLNAAKVDMAGIAQEYEKRAGSHQLHFFQASARGNEHQLVLANLTKGELTELYSSHMVGASKPGRMYYDQLMMHAPLGKCPFCGFGQASTLDHFLSKALYPAFSILVGNLIPACADCNKGKGASVVTVENQLLHPYFESHSIESDTWLFVEVVQSTPPSARYFIQPPAGWALDLVSRLRNHFKELKLAARFAVEAASELASISDLLSLLETDQMRQKHLATMAEVERKNRKNSWKAALYDALSNNAWFHATGYQR